MLSIKVKADEVGNWRMERRRGKTSRFSVW